MSRAHITGLVAENVKRLRVVRLEFQPGGGLIEVSGANGSGKSSLLDAIGWALLGRGAIDPKPIRDGAETAVVSLTLGDVVVTRKFTATGSTLTVESKEGARFPSPQKMLDDLVGDSVLTFDPLAFDRMKPADQLEEVRKVAPLPPEVDHWRALAKAAFEKRTDVNRRAKELAGKLAGEPAIPVPVVDGTVAELTAKLADVGRVNAENDRESERRIALLAEAERREEEAKRLRVQAEEVLDKARRLEEAARVDRHSLGKSQPIPDNVDASDILRAIERAREAERIVEKNARRAALVAESNAADQESKDLTEAIVERERQIREAVTAAKMPVPGLTYGETGLEFNGHPFEQASGAERLRVALGLAMAQRPGLRVVRIKDGSLLDENSLRLVADLAEAADFQVLIERVDTTGRVGVVLEEGEVVKVNAGTPGGTDGAE